MIEKLQIAGFKCFRQFEIDGLRRINLIAGKNSVGKSALLEALRLYLCPDPYGLMDTLAWRDEIQLQGTLWNPDVIRELFHGSSPDEAAEIVLQGAHRVRMRMRWAEWDPNINDWRRGPEPAAPRVPDPNKVRGLSWEVMVNALDEKRFIRLDDHSPLRALPFGSWNFNDAVMRGARSDPPVLYVPNEGLSSAFVCQLFERIVATETEDNINAMLRWVVPDAERLLTKGTASERILYLKRRGAKAPEPLKRFGDGAVRITALGLALANAGNGYCLIDEVENGVHFELFDSIWEHLSKMAQEFNVQLFLTSHSKDCLEAFGRTYESRNFDACYYRLESYQDKVTAVRLDNESFFSAVRGTPYEVR